jgi:dolichyl-diphosphooligosaccharide--protein glycosyltransferase
VNLRLDTPADTVDALQHYRIVYEEDGNGELTASGHPRSVKVFEYVKGSRMKGEGFIEVTVQTNLGRTFVYRQESKNGEFILPYSTQENPNPVKTVGSYRILPSGRTIEVTEQDVREGTIIER